MKYRKSQEAMPKQTPTKRKYDSSRRKEHARQTRLQIAEAARKLFFERGYAGATIEAIAEHAGVAKETIYAIFKNKREILAFLLDISVGGDDLPVRIIDRPEQKAMLLGTDQSRQLDLFARGITEVMSRAAPVFEVTRIAAKTEPEIARRIKHLYRERLENMATIVHHVAANGPLQDGLDEAQAAEIIWALTSPELFQLVNENLSWSKEKYSQWLAGILKRLILP
jgi:AcrR family transcriptional regulator